METYILTFVFFVFSHASNVSAWNISNSYWIDCQDFWCLYEEACKQAGFKLGQDLTNTGRLHETQEQKTQGANTVTPVNWQRKREKDRFKYTGAIEQMKHGYTQ